jgi:uncharacterized protein (DUF2252 family)
MPADRDNLSPGELIICEALQLQDAKLDVLMETVAQTDALIESLIELVAEVLENQGEARGRFGDAHDERVQRCLTDLRARAREYVAARARLVIEARQQREEET